MPNTQELLLQLIDDEDESSKSTDADVFMQYVLNKGLEFIPHIYQTGIKNGQTLRAHIQNVMCFCWGISEVFQIEDSDKLNLIAAAYLHDMNKFPEYQKQNYKAIATNENIQKHLSNILLESGYSFDFDIDLIKTIMLAHSGHLHQDGDGLFAKSKYMNRNILIGLIQTSDILDLSHHFHEKDKKENALRIINGQIKDFQYEYAWHYFSDNRGIYTNLIHNVIINVYKKQGAIPLLFYPEGVWYLVKKGSNINISVNEITLELQKYIDKMLTKDSIKLLKEQKGVAFHFTQNPFQLGLTADDVINLLETKITEQKEKSLKDKFEKLENESPKKRFEAYKEFMKKSEELSKKFKQSESGLQKLISEYKLQFNFDKDDADFLKLKDKDKTKILKKLDEYSGLKNEFETTEKWSSQPLWDSEPKNLFSSDFETMRCGKMVGSIAYLLYKHMDIDSKIAWKLSAETAGILFDEHPELMFFDEQSDKCFRIGTLLKEKGIGFENIIKKYLSFIKSLTNTNNNNSDDGKSKDFFNYISLYLLTNQDSSIKCNLSLKPYIESNHKQCCHCGSGTASEWSAGDIPSGIKLQLFSNRLKGGGGAPVRYVCSICRQSFIIEKIVNERYENHYYLHFFSDGGDYSSHAEPGVFLDSLKKGLMNLQQVDCRSFFMKPNAIIKEYLNQKIPRLCGEVQKSRGILIPKFSESISGQITITVNPPDDNDSTKFVFALFHLLIMVNHFNLRGIMSKSSIPPLKSDEFSKIYIDHIPLPFKALVPENNIDHEGTEKLWLSLASLYGLRNIYHHYDDEEIPKIAKTLYDESCLDIFYYMHKKMDEKDPNAWNKSWPFLKIFIQEEKLMPIKKMAEIALINHFHGSTWKETSQAKPLDLAFDALLKHREPETKEDLKMVIMHDVTRGLERLSSHGSLGKDRYPSVKEFVDVFFNEIFTTRYKSDKNTMLKDQKRIRSAFLAYLNVLRSETKNNQKEEITND
ncbi:MAG: type I-D CRISPR-associated protein Cas10d/Csc3 [Desulfobacterales bacterium]|nr:type I-D CRISPR-associated protein Cas10d/Csc3 [Desulfobacterales bacterium]